MVPNNGTLDNTVNITGTAATTKLLVQNTVNDSSNSGIFLGNQIRGEASIK